MLFSPFLYCGLLDRAALQRLIKTWIALLVSDFRDITVRLHISPTSAILCKFHKLLLNMENAGTTVDVSTTFFLEKRLLF